MSDAKYDPEICARLAREARADDAALRATDPECTCNGAAWCEDQCPAYPRMMAHKAASERYEANLLATADHLEAAQARIAELEKRLEDEERDCGDLIDEREFRESQINAIADVLGDEGEWSNLHDRGDAALELAEQIVAERDAANARILQLEESARAAAESWMAACRERDEARAEVERLRIIAKAYAAAETSYQDDSGNAGPLHERMAACDRALDAWRDAALDLAAERSE
ncbi:MAG TPA: hypothetical protein VFQ42_22185 [Mycobacterium sp.]|nr:hypothetical protein [Mycobacterium sp.]